MLDLVATALLVLSSTVLTITLFVFAAPADEYRPARCYGDCSDPSCHVCRPSTQQEKTRQ